MSFLVRRLFLAATVIAVAGCSAIVERQTAQLADDLETAIRQYDDPVTVADALPAYLLLLEARLQSNPDSAGLRLTSARLTGLHATLSAEGPERSLKKLTKRALEHARHGACASTERLCAIDELPYPELDERLAGLVEDDLVPAYILATSWVGWIDAHSGDYAALADLPRAQALLERVVEMSPSHDDGLAWLYLAVLHSQRPPAAGGRPDLAREYFEKARAISEGRNLLVDVMLADHYARLVFDRELFVGALRRVVDSEVDSADNGLVNALARRRARQLLERTERIFD